jgi:hypothetical protein
VGSASPSLLTRLRQALGLLLIAVGVLVLAAGVLYWWKDWVAARLVLGLGAATGLGLVGLGALASWPTSAAGCLSASLALGGSGALFFMVSLLQPLLPALPIVGASMVGLGILSYVGYLFNRRRSSQPTTTPPPPPPVQRP